MSVCVSVKTRKREGEIEKDIHRERGREIEKATPGGGLGWASRDGVVRGGASYTNGDGYNRL